MHELAIAQSIVEVVETQAIESKATKVKGVRLQIGEGSGIVGDSLLFCFEMVCSLNPLLEGAELWIDSIPYRARCLNCNREFTVLNFIRQCPDCQKWDTEIISGTELQILEMEIEDNNSP